MLHAAVQEERQRAKDKNENEVESTSCANEDMPVEKILEAEQAVEPKTETYIETNLGVPSNSVSLHFLPNTLILQQVITLCLWLCPWTHIHTHIHTAGDFFKCTPGAGRENVFSHVHSCIY